MTDILLGTMINDAYNNKDWKLYEKLKVIEKFNKSHRMKNDKTESAFTQNDANVIAKEIENLIIESFKKNGIALSK